MQNARVTLTAIPEIRIKSSADEKVKRTPTKNATNADGPDDGPWNSGCCVRNLLRDMDTRVKRACTVRECSSA